MLDSGCTRGNWISWDLVSRLGVSSEIKTSTYYPDIVDFHPQPIEVIGSVFFKWRLPEGASMHGLVEFYVADSGLKFDLIFGREYQSRQIPHHGAGQQGESL